MVHNATRRNNDGNQQNCSTLKNQNGVKFEPTSHCTTYRRYCSIGANIRHTVCQLSSSNRYRGIKLYLINKFCCLLADCFAGVNWMADYETTTKFTQLYQSEYCMLSTL